jgi:MOSC domain-containing protein
VSTASVRELARYAGSDVDAGRFRMTFELDGVDAHEEDEWIGQRISIGDAVVVPAATVARCAVTTRHPATGVRDLDTLRIIAGYRTARTTRLNINFGVSASVATPGPVRVGDRVELLDPARS